MSVVASEAAHQHEHHDSFNTTISSKKTIFSSRIALFVLYFYY
jgi:hypothetical protein